MMRRYLLLIAITCLLASCEKKEDAIVLPDKGKASSGSVTMGAGYEKQVFYDFETGTSVFTSSPDSWDLAFETSGRHIFQNGGQGVFTYNTHEQDIQKVTSLPAQLSPATDTGWQYDNPTGLPGGTAIGDWWQNNGLTKGDVYIVRLKSGLQKMRVLAGDDYSYSIEWMPLYGSGAPTQIRLQKDSAFNYVYFSFTKGITKPEPPDKTSWDVVFTQYRELVYDSDPYIMRAIPYVVTGALLNPLQTAAVPDSTDDFSAISLNKAETMPLSGNRNIIGYDWKTVTIAGASGTYAVNPHKSYVLGTMEGHLYKLHFLSFYGNGQKGTPLFEYERLK